MTWVSMQPPHVGHRLRTVECEWAMPVSRTVLIGDIGTTEFEYALQQSGITAASVESVEVAADLQEMDLALLAVHTPAQWSSGWLEELRRAAPLTEFVAVLGTWCEGESRTGWPLAADERLFWYQLPAWWHERAEADSLSHRSCGMAAGESAEARLLRLSGSSLAQLHPTNANGSANRLCRPLAVVASSCQTSAEALALACQHARWATLRHDPSDSPPQVTGAAVLMWDSGQLADCELDQLRRCRDRLGNPSAIAVADFPRIDRVLAARDVGVVDVIGKPYLLREVKWALQRAWSKECASIEQAADG